MKEKHFLSTEKGKVDYGAIIGEASEVKEVYDFDKDKYLITFPKSKYTTYYNDFAGWGYEGKVYQPGQTMYVDANSTNRKIVAQWKPKFFKPQLVVKKGLKMLTLDWTVVSGANEGYKVYFSAKKQRYQ